MFSLLWTFLVIVKVLGNWDVSSNLSGFIDDRFFHLKINQKDSPEHLI